MRAQAFSLFCPPSRHLRADTPVLEPLQQNLFVVVFMPVSAKMHAAQDSRQAPVLQVVGLVYRRALAKSLRALCDAQARTRADKAQ